MAKAEETIVTAAKCYTEQEAAIICQHLAVNDIPAQIDGRLTAGSSFYGFGSINVWVLSGDVERAKDLIHSHLAMTDSATQVAVWIWYARIVVWMMIAGLLTQAAITMFRGLLLF